MVKADATINNEFLRISINLDPTNISSTGDTFYPRLVVPLHLECNPVFQDHPVKRMQILDIKTELFVGDNRIKISDSNNIQNPYMLFHGSGSRVYTLEFPLDIHRISRIEDIRNGDLLGYINFSLIVAIYSGINGGPRNVELISEITSQGGQINFSVPKSHWVDRILPGLGYGKVQIVELPRIDGHISEQYNLSMREISQAREYYINGDYDKAVAHCRSALEPMKKVIPLVKDQFESNTSYEWFKIVGTTTCDWLDKIQKATQGITSKSHHVPSIGHFSKYDAESILLVTLGIIEMCSTLSNE